jgi:hypothetical protein
MSKETAQSNIKSAVTAEQLKAILTDKKYYQHQFSVENMVYITVNDASYYGIGDLTHITIGTGQLDYGDFSPEICWHVFSQYYFAMVDMDEAIDIFLTQINSDDPLKSTAVSRSLKYIKIKTDRKLVHSSHYDYASEVAGIVLMEVSKAVRPITQVVANDLVEGIMFAHGDKMHQYKNDFEEGGVPFEHGVVLQVLSYTVIYGANVRQDLVKWVIANYPKYKQIILAAEKKVLFEKYDVTFSDNIIGPI